MRILLLTETYKPEIGGGERQAELLARSLTQRGHRVTIMARASRGGLQREEADAGTRVRRVPPTGPGRWKKWGLLMTTLPPLMRQKSEFDVVLVSGFRLLGVPAMLARVASGTPTILKADSPGEMSGDYFRAGLSSAGLRPEFAVIRMGLAGRNRLLLRADAFVAMSEAIERELLNCGVDSARVHRIPNGVDTQVFHPCIASERREIRQRLALPNDDTGPVAVFTGRLVSYKGLPVLLRAWKTVLESVPEAKLLLVGGGSADMHNCEQELRKFVADHDMGASVQFVGAVSNVEDWLRAADLFVFPTENEAFGLSLVEAMACGLPCVTTTVGGIDDFVDDYVNALTIEPGQETDLAEAIKRIALDRSLASRLGDAARHTILNRFGADSVAEAYAAVFERLLETPGPTAGS